MNWYNDNRDEWKEIISSGCYKTDYNNVTQKLLYEKMTYEEAIEEGIAVIAKLDVFDS